MISVDKELIAKELECVGDIEEGLVYKRCKLSNRFLDNLFNKYYTVEICQNFYEIDNLSHCTWQDPLSEGTWKMTQNDVDKISKELLKDFKKLPVSKKNRIYYTKRDDSIMIFLYGRDIENIVNKDIWFIFKKK